MKKLRDLLVFLTVLGSVVFIVTYRVGRAMLLPQFYAGECVRRKDAEAWGTSFRIYAVGKRNYQIATSGFGFSGDEASLSFLEAREYEKVECP